VLHQCHFLRHSVKNVDDNNDNGINVNVILAKSFQAHISLISQHKAPSVEVFSIAESL